MSPVRQFLARKPNTYWLPRLAIDPSRTAAPPARSQISLATSAVSDASAGWLIRLSIAWIRWSETRLRNGDCSSCTANPWRSVPSNTGSPVALMKSATRVIVASRLESRQVIWAIFRSCFDFSDVEECPYRYVGADERDQVHDVLFA